MKREGFGVDTGSVNTQTDTFDQSSLLTELCEVMTT